MHSSRSPLGILLAHTLPAIVLFLLYGGMVRVVQPLLSTEAMHLWRVYGALLAGITAVSTLYAIVLLVTKRPVHILYSVLIFCCYVPLLWGFVEQTEILIPWEIPRWMMPEDAVLYSFRLLSIPLVHALFILIAGSLVRDRNGSPLRDLLIAVSIPLGAYLFVQVVEPWRRGFDFERHVWLVLMVVAVVLFLFFLLRGIVVLAQRRSPSDMVATLLHILVGLVLPVLGLAVNNGIFKMDVNGVFGDLGHWGFYIVAVLNGIAVAWGSSTDPRIRSWQFVLRAIGFSYVLYFFVLFVPLLPLSIIAVLAVGVGFLLLAPVLLFMVQGLQLVKDMRFLRTHYSISTLIPVLCASLLVLPTIITIRYLHHRTVLHDALAYVYQADPSQKGVDHLNAEALRTVLDHVESNKERNRLGGSHTPFLSPWYNYVVLDNLSIGSEKMSDLRTIFFDAPLVVSERSLWRPETEQVHLYEANARTHYDAQQQIWRTWVDLTIRNTEAVQGEYVTAFNLPAGAWISDDYLMIGDRRVKGILAEKKAATWVYQQIVSYRQDPSIIRYIGPDRVQLRVFPFGEIEERKAGFEVLHKEPFSLEVDGCTLLLGDTEHAPPTVAITSPEGNAVYIPAALKRTLPKVERKANVHFMVDGTEKFRPFRQAALHQIEQAIVTQHLDPTAITLHIVDAYPTAVPWNEKAKDRYLEYKGEGGSFTDRAVRNVLIAACAHPDATRPVIVLVPSNDPESGYVPFKWLENLGDVAACIPEGSMFYTLESGILKVRSFLSPEEDLPQETAVDLAATVPVRAWPSTELPQAYLSMEPGAAIAMLHAAHGGTATKYAQDNWSDALSLEGRWRAGLLRPDGGTAAWRDLVRGSFQVQVLTPVTAWMCLEDDAQRNALLKKQEEMLQANAALDASDETVTRMSEPGMLWLLVPILLALWNRWKGWSI